MNNAEKVRNAFTRSGFTGGTKIRKNELEQFLNSLMKAERGEAFDQEVAGQLWEQASKGSNQIFVDDICQVIIDGQDILQNKLLQIDNEIKYLASQINTVKQSSSPTNVAKIEEEIYRLNQQKVEFEEDLRLLTEPFGISAASFMARAATASKSRYTTNNNRESEKLNLDERGNQVELKWLFFLSIALGIIEIIVIYRKYDFLNLIVFTCLSFIFLLNHFDQTYIKFVLALLVASQVLDAIWLFMNSSDYWNPPGNGTSSGYEKGYLKLIIVLAYLGIFIKIPLGVVIYHYRNVQEDKTYELDVGVVKFSLSANKINPITHGINNFTLNN